MGSDYGAPARPKAERDSEAGIGSERSATGLITKFDTKGTQADNALSKLTGRQIKLLQSPLTMFGNVN